MRKSTPIQFAIRVLIYCVALFLLALGVAISVNGNLGVSPVNSLPYIISQIINVPMGTCVTALFCFYILLQIVFSTVFGYFVDFAKLLIGDFVIPTYFGRLTMLGISIVLIAVGITLYMDTELVPMSTEGLAACLAKKLNKPFPTMKTVMDCVIVGTGLTLSLVFLGKLDGIREGTIITAVVVGKLIAVCRKWISAPVKKICFGE